MITETQYEDYLGFLLEGNRGACTRLVRQLMDQGLDIKTLYTDLFQKSLYRVGELWETNRITVAREHLATAITEGMMHLAYPGLFEVEQAQPKRRVVISCAANEYHQVGGKMVADIFQLHGWDAQFLGADTPVDHMLEHIQEVRPDLVGLSLSVYFNMAALKSGVAAIRSNFRQLDIVIGGQAFRWGGVRWVRDFPATEYIPTLDDVESSILEA